MTDNLQGQLLIASGDLLDPNFRRTVVLVAHHDEDGAMGLVLNRPSEAEVAQAVPPLSEAVLPGTPVYVGGPVQPESVLVLGEFDDAEESGVPIFGDVGFLRGDAEPGELETAARRVRVFAGYAGWGTGQLEAELEEGSWIVEPASPEDVFRSEGDLWGDLLRRKGGRYRILATMPADPSVN
jgi:putative transcriptional regulator